MIDILIRENYFENPNKIRELALSSKNYRIDNDIENMSNGWKGQRTPPFRSLKNQYCACCNRPIEEASPSDQLMVDYSRNIFDICDEHFKFTEKCSEEMTITSFFHITTEKIKDAYPNFWQDRFHKDQHSPIAGVVYLSPDAPKNTGTSILDGQNNQFVNVENKYNRLVAYDGFRIHALSDVFGTSKETGRMTFTFFIHTVGDSRFFN